MVHAEEEPEGGCAAQVGESAATRRSRGSLALAGTGVFTVALVLVATTSHHSLSLSSSALSASEGTVGLGMRAGAERDKPRRALRRAFSGLGTGTEWCAADARLKINIDMI